jgi:hypothetical protein
MANLARRAYLLGNPQRFLGLELGARMPVIDDDVTGALEGTGEDEDEDEVRARVSPWANPSVLCSTRSCFGEPSSRLDDAIGSIVALADCIVSVCESLHGPHRTRSDDSSDPEFARSRGVARSVKSRAA